MTTLFLVLQVIFAIVITIAVLLQKSSSIGLGAYSGSNESLFGAKGPAGFLAKFTAFMGILFVANTLALAYFYQQDAKSSVIDRVKVEQKQSEAPKNAVPAVPSAPKANSLNLKPSFDNAANALQSGAEKISEAVENNASAAVEAVKENAASLENNVSQASEKIEQKASELGAAIEGNATEALKTLSDQNQSK